MKKILLTTGALALAASAYAGGPVMNTVAPAHGTFYAGAGLGWASFYKSVVDPEYAQYLGSVYKVTKSGMAARAHFGYLLPISHMAQVGAEVGYTHFPTLKVASTTGTIKSKFYGLDLLAVAKFNVTDAMNLFAKAGFIQMNSTANINSSETTARIKYSEVYTKAALGAGYTIMPNLDATLTYAHVFDIRDVSTSSNSVLAGLDYYFSV